MAGIFGLFDFTKEGPGVDIDEPEKGPIADFFTIFFGKFWKLITINFMMVIFNVLAIAASFYITNWVIPFIFPNFSYDRIFRVLNSANLALEGSITVADYAGFLFASTVMVFTFAFVALQAVLIGPVQAGISYLMRSFSRHQPCFIWMDFKDTVKNNWKQSLIHSTLTAVVYVLFCIAFYYYGNNISNPYLSVFLRSLIVMGIILVTLMNFYVYQMIITFELSLKDVYKNALIFAFMRLPSNIAVLLILLIVDVIVPVLAIWMIPSGLVSIIIVLLYLLILLSLSSLLINYQANRGIYKQMLKPILDKQKAEEQVRMAQEWEALASVDEEEANRVPDPEEDADGRSETQNPETDGLPSGFPA